MLTWVSVNALDGTVNDYLPNLVPQGPCAVTIGKYETLGFTLAYPKSVVDYSQALANGKVPNPSALAHLADLNKAIAPGLSVLIALDESQRPVWGGLILTTTMDHTEQVTLSAVTLEAYFDRRITGTYLTVGEDQNLVVADLINQFIVTGVLPGLPITVVNTASASPTSQTFYDYDDKTVYANLQAMSAVQNGPQWTIGWRWQASPLRITPVLYVADRIGTPLSASLSRPNAVFSLPGPVSSVSYVNDWSAGKGANRVTATGQGQGLTRPEDSENAANFNGRPTFEFRYAPPQTALSTLTVAQHALAALAALQNGTQTVALTADRTKAPVFGTDWFLGDDIGINVMAPAFIDGSLLNAVGHCIGLTFDDNFVTPILFVQDASQL